MSNTSNFTYIIRSPVTGNTNNINLNLMGLPSQYQYFDCVIQGFYTCISDTTINANVVQLQCQGIDILNGKDSSKNLQTIALSPLNNDKIREPFRFRCANFNGKLLNFQLLNESGALVQYGANSPTAYSTPWILVLNITCI